MRSLGLDEDCDETCTRYFQIMHRRSRKIEATPESVMKQAMKVYHELMVKEKEPIGK